MSPVGHSIVGATIGALFVPKFESKKSRVLTVLGMIALANLPDWPVPGWGHRCYYLSHSLPVGITLFLVSVGLIRQTHMRNSIWGSWSFLVACAAAVFSHYLLDSFYNHGKGVAIFWPLSDARLILPIPWFSHMHLEPLWSWHNVKAWAIELLFYGMLSFLILRAASAKK